MKRMLTLFVLMSGIGIALAGTAFAGNAIVGRITDHSVTSLSVRASEIVTFSLDSHTTYTKWITQKPLQEDTRLTSSALAVGRLVTVQRAKDNGSVAAWVQIATDIPIVSTVAHSPAAQSESSATASRKSKSSELLTSRQVKELIATATTPADHLKLQKHFLALAAKYEADAKEHAAEAEAYRKNPSFRDSKNPAGPGTAAHCERFVELDQQAAKEARDLASAHEHMATAK